MQTFLASKSFEYSAACLDGARLRKQKIEVETILQTLCGESTAWRNHPCVLQWVGYESSLRWYGLDILSECLKRGFNVDTSYSVTECAEDPPWLGDERLHSSHRSRLLFKGRVDAVTYSLRSFLQVRSINSWLIWHSFPEKRLFTLENAVELERYAKGLGVKIAPNHYAQFNWKESDCDEIPYFWPSKNEY